VLASQAWAAAERLAERGIELAVAIVPWLRDLDGGWLAEIAGSGPLITLDNHYLEGGQGDAVLRAIAAHPEAPAVLRIGVESVPVCGDNDAVLRAHGLDADSIADRVQSTLATA
jgi:transketolase